jgi:integrase
MRSPADSPPARLRHTFASVAGDLGFSELTIAGLLGHAARGVTQGYVHMDAALVVAADRVSAEIAQMLGGASAAKPARKMLKKRPENSMVA